MTEYVLSLDPGLSTGVALLSYDETSAPVLEKTWQFRGGVVGLTRWSRDHTYDYIEGAEVFTVGGPFSPDDGPDFGDYVTPWMEDRGLTIVTEKFTARATKGFSYRTDALEPLRCEGALIALGIMPDYDVSEKRWLDPNHQYLVGGKDKADKKKRQHKFLKDSGFYVLGSDLGTKDADDARSAIAHGISYLARVKKHKRSYRLIAEWLERNPV